MGWTAWVCRSSEGLAWCIAVGSLAALGNGQVWKQGLTTFVLRAYVTWVIRLQRSEKRTRLMSLGTTQPTAWL